MPVSITPNLPTITRTDLGEALIQGKTFSASIKTSVVNGGTLSLTIVTPASPAKVGLFETNTNVQGNSGLDFIEAPTVTIEGSSVTSFDVNRITDNTASSTIREDDTITGGAILFSTLINAGEKSKVTGGSAGSDRGWILKASTVYVIKLTNTAGVEQEMQISYRFVEET